jgi:eukaryotic-like serine/threonine-protein kinase
MSPECWRRIKQIAGEAMDLEPGERTEFLSVQCGGDEELREHVERLLLRMDAESAATIEQAIGAAAAEVGASVEGDSLTGRRISHYRIEEMLGRGGMGVVYRAHDTKLERRVALKFLAPHLVENKDGRERFLREARAAAALDHANICTVHEIDEADGQAFLAMAYVEGGTVRDKIAEGPLPLDEALDIAIQMAEGLREAHQSGVVHRDIKPRNVMLNSAGRVKITDFGLAQLSGRTQITMSGTILGTLAYMSPEQLEGRKTDGRSDIWAFGVVLYEMLVQRTPFDADYQQAISHGILNKAPEPVTALRSDLPAEIDRVLEKALAKSPDERYQRMDELLVDLRALRDPASSSRIRRTVPRPSSRTVVLLAAAAAIVALALLPEVREPTIGWINRVTTQSGPDLGVDPNATPRELVVAGEAALMNHDEPEEVKRAIGLFERAIAAEPTLATAQAGLAEARFEEFRANEDPVLLRRASQSAKEAVRLDDHLAAAHAINGRILGWEGQHDEALSELGRARVLNPQDPDVYMGLAEVAAAQQNLEEAEAFFAKAIALAPGDWRLLERMAVLQFRRARYEEATETVDRWLSLDPDNVYGLLTRASLLAQQGRPAEASAALQKALEIRPEANAYSNLGTLLYYQGRYSEAANAYERAIELKPNERLFWANLGDAYRSIAGQAEKARDAYLRAAQLVQDELNAKPDDTVLLSELAGLRARQGDDQGALETLTRLETLATDEPGVWFAAVKAYEIAGYRNKALAALVRSIEAGYSLTEIQNEQELVALRNDHRYHRLVSPYQGDAPQ